MLQCAKSILTDSWSIAGYHRQTFLSMPITIIEYYNIENATNCQPVSVWGMMNERENFLLSHPLTG